MILLVILEDFLNVGIFRIYFCKLEEFLVFSLLGYIIIV